jgi:hypothetical protein
VTLSRFRPSCVVTGEPFVQEPPMISDAFRQASLVAIASTLMGILPLGMGVVYAIWPSEQRLALMRPLSLATVFAAISGSTVGLINVLIGITGTNATPEFTRVSAVGLAESLVPIFFGFGCLTAAWLLVALGLWRRP